MLSLRLFLPFALSLGVACQAEMPPPRPFDGAQAFRYLEAQLAFGPRVPGTEAHRTMGRWLDSLSRLRADTVIIQDWLHETLTGDSLPLRNVLARFNPEAEERILFLAHWDSRPRADGARSNDPDLPVPGANDGASGVAVLLAMADALRDAPPTVGIDLLYVDGEDYGVFADDADVLIGSRYYAANLPPGPRPEFAVLFDLVGDIDQSFPQEGNSVIGAPDVVEKVWDAAADLGYGHIFVTGSQQAVLDDHVPLQQVGIPAINIIDFDYDAWHTPFDTIDKVSAASLQVVGEVGLELVRRAER